MLRIAVCDDEPLQLQRMTAQLEPYLESRPELEGRI